MSPGIRISTIILNTISHITCANYTYWRFGDGSFTNTLPVNHTLFSTGLLSDNPVYSYLSPLNQSNQTYFYPLITETNDIFTFVFTQHNNETQPLNQTLSLIKLNQYLNETIATLSLKIGDYPSSSCGCSYPIYHEQQTNEYIIVNVAQTTEDCSFGSTYLLIINATSMNIISVNITSVPPEYQAPPMHVAIYDQYIIQQLKLDSLTQSINYTAFDFQGEAIWDLGYVVHQNFWSTIFALTMKPVGINDKIIITNISDNGNQGIMNFKLIGLNAANGDTVWESASTNFWNEDGTYVLQPVVHQSYNIVIVAISFESTNNDTVVKFICKRKR